MEYPSRPQRRGSGPLFNPQSRIFSSGSPAGTSAVVTTTATPPGNSATRAAAAALRPPWATANEDSTLHTPNVAEKNITTTPSPLAAKLPWATGTTSQAGTPPGDPLNGTFHFATPSSAAAQGTARWSPADQGSTLGPASGRRSTDAAAALPGGAMGAGAADAFATPGVPAKSAQGVGRVRPGLSGAPPSAEAAWAGGPDPGTWAPRSAGRPPSAPRMQRAGSLGAARAPEPGTSSTGAGAGTTGGYHGSSSTGAGTTSSAPPGAAGRRGVGKEAVNTGGQGSGGKTGGAGGMMQRSSSVPRSSPGAQAAVDAAQERGRRPVLPVSRSRSSSSSATPPLSLLHNSPPLQQPAWNFGTAESGARVETPGGRPGNSSSGWAGDGPLQEDGAVSADALDIQATLARGFPPLKHPSSGSTTSATHEGGWRHEDSAGQRMELLHGGDLAMEGPLPQGLEHPRARSRAAATSAQEVAALKEDNSALRAEVSQLRALLGIVQEGEATSRAVPVQQQPAMLARYRAQLWQCQRQVVVLGAELQAQRQVASEAEGILQEVRARLSDIVNTTAAVSTPAAKAASGEGGVTAGDVRASADLTLPQLQGLHRWAQSMGERIRSSRAQAARSLTKQALESRRQQAESTMGGMGSATGASPGASWDVPLWQLPYIPCGGNRYLAASSAAAAAQQEADAGEAQAEASLAAAAEVAASQHRLVSVTSGALASQLALDQVTPGGGHLGLLRAASANGGTYAALGPASAALLRSPSTAHVLEEHVTTLAPKVASLAVLLRSTVLPALPWLETEAADRVQAEVAETAGAVAHAAGLLSELLSLAPAGGTPLAVSGSTRQGSLKGRGAEVQAGRDAWLWGHADLAEGTAASAPNPAPPGPLDPVPALCGVDLDAVVGALAPLLKDRKAAGVKGCKDVLITSLGPALHAVAIKEGLLEAELKFAARAVALQAQHVSQFMRQVMADIEGACDASQAAGSAAGGPPSPQMVGSPPSAATSWAAVNAVRQLLEAHSELTRRPSEGALADLVDLLGHAKSGLQAAEQLLSTGGSGGLGRIPATGGTSSTAAASGGSTVLLSHNSERPLIDGRALLARLASVHEGFRKALSTLGNKKQAARARVLAAHKPSSPQQHQLQVDEPSGIGGGAPAGRPEGTPTYVLQMPWDSPWDVPQPDPGITVGLLSREVPHVAATGGAQQQQQQQRNILRPDWQG